LQSAEISLFKMDFEQWGPITDGFDLNLLSDTVGYIWSPPGDAGGVFETAEYPIENVSADHKSLDDLLITLSQYPMESATGPYTSSNSSSSESFHSQEYDTPPNDDDGEGGSSERSRSMGRPRFPVQSSRDATMNRIQVLTFLDRLTDGS
jgi:hypothetical protein